MRISKIWLVLSIFLIFNITSFSSCRFFGRKTLPRTNAKDVGMSKEHLDLIPKIIEEAIAHKNFPGAVILVARKGKVVLRETFGESQWIPRHQPMTASMIFDLASLTKPMATATSIMILAEQGRLSLWDKVKDYLPEFAPFINEKGEAGEDARLWHLLTHTSGLPSYIEATEVEKKYGSPCSIESLVYHIAQLKKLDLPGKTFNYSCLGFITLAYIVKKVSGQDIARFSEKYIFTPLKMNRTFYKPPKKFLSLCAPTQVTGGKPLTGVVHDPLARLQGGVSGNAGLFSTADDLAIFAQMLLNKGEHNGVRILSPLTVERMTSIYPRAQFAGRGLGWDLSSSYSSSGGDIFGTSSYGHTGYTGTSIWIDPETETFVIFLTNRVHPDDKNTFGTIRGRIANVVASSIIEK